MPKYFAFLTVILLLASGLHAAAIPKYIKRNQATILQQWLTRNNSFSVVVDVDCKCEWAISNAKNYQSGKYHPYYAIGDFNGDGFEDFAVAVKTVREPNARFDLLIFNGPLVSAKIIEPSFIGSKALMPGRGLFRNAMGKRVCLSFGPFESGGECNLTPKGKSYQEDCGSREAKK